MGTRQDAHFTADWSNIRRSTAISAYAALQNHLTYFGVFQRVQHQLGVPISIGIIRLEFRDRFIPNLIESLLASSLVGNQNRFTNWLSDEMANLVRQRRLDIF